MKSCYYCGADLSDSPFIIEDMLNFLEQKFTNDFGFQWEDTCCAWHGWIGYNIDNSFALFSGGTL